jgi:Tfp pilus assembly protein PilF
MTEASTLPRVLAGLAALPAAEAADAARADQDRRWAAGECVPAEAYLDALPAVAADPDHALVLIYGEVLSRTARGERPTLAEYQARFPHLADRLAVQFDLHAAIAGPAGTPPVGTAVLTGPAAPTGPSATSTPERIGEFEVVSELGRGGMGLVLAARDRSLDREVAVKTLIPGRPAAPEAVRRFVRESKITARLSHPGIPPVHAIGELPDGTPYLSMKLIRGRTLADLLRERPLAELPRFVGIFEQVCQAVGYAHSKGIVHRDLKPANVMVGDFGEVQVMDWGVATDLSGGREPPERTTAQGAHAPRSEPDHTQAGAVLGTPAFMAPEQARGEEVDARADVFALGGILCAILTGKPPFAAPTLPASLRMAAAGDVSAALDRLGASGADAELIDVARRCLSADPATRPAGGSEAAGLVAAYRAGVEARLRKAETERAAAVAREAEGRRRRRAQLLLAASVGLLLLGGGGVAWWWNTEVLRQRHAEDRRRERLADGVAALVERCEAALRAEDADEAGQFLTAAVKRTRDEPGAYELYPRLTRCRADLDLLQALNDVDVTRWTTVEDRPARSDALTAKWGRAFERYGVVPGVTPPADAARLVGESLIRDRAVVSLGLWSNLDPRPELLAVLRAVDPHPYRDAVREAAAARNWDRVVELARQPDYLAQPPRFAPVLAQNRAVPAARRREVLVLALDALPGDLTILMTLADVAAQRLAPKGAVRWSSEVRLRPSGGPDRSRAEGAADAVRWMQAAVAAHPRNPAARTNLGVALDEAGDLDAAARSFEAALRIDPGFAVAHNNLGTVAARRRDPNGAVAHFRKAVEHDPTVGRFRYNLGVQLTETGKADEAADCFRASIERDPTYARAHANLATLLVGKGDRDGALAAYQESLRHDPTDPVIQNNVGALLLRRGKAREAVGYFQAALKYDPGYTLARLNLAAALAMSLDVGGKPGATGRPVAPPPRPVDR